MKENFSNISTRIKEMLEKNGLKQIQACQKVNISKNAMSNYINGNRIPDTLSLYKLSVLFNVSMEWLLTGSEKENFINTTSENLFNIEHSKPGNSNSDDNLYLSSKEDNLLITKFNAVSDTDREEILTLLEMKYNRTISKNQKSSISKTGKIDLPNKDPA